MKPYKLKIPVGGLVAPFVGLGANYIRLESASAPINIKDAGSSQEVDLISGEDSNLHPFNELHISHSEATEQSITILVGRDTKKSSSKVSGSMQPVGGSDNLANPPTVKIDSAVNVASAPAVEVGDLEYYRQSDLAIQVNEIVSPAANINGVRVISCFIRGQQQFVRLHYKEITPVDYLDGLSVFWGGTEELVGFKYHDIAVSMPVLVPAGFGLYESNSVADSMKINVNYKIL